MEFTEAIPAFGGKASLSPNGHLLARLTPGPDFILLIQDTDALSVQLSTPVPLMMDNDAATSAMPKSKHFPPPKPRRIRPADIQLSWSPDSSKLMVIDGLVNRVFVYDLTDDDPEGFGFILQESMPTSRFIWSPKSDYIVSVLEHRIGLRVWSLQSRYPIKSITGIKSSTEGIDFCPAGNMMAVIHRKENQDYIAIYSCATWNPIQVLRPPEASLLHDIKFATGRFSRNNVCERPLLYAWELPCLLHIFGPDGSCRIVDVYSGEESSIQESFGFSSIAFSPSGNLAAFTSNDGKIVLWNTLLQKPITKISVSSELSLLPNLVAFKERLVYGDEGKFVRYESGFGLMLNELQNKNGGESIPIIQAKFSYDSKFLAIHSSNFPYHLWIYNIPTMTFLSVVCQLPTNGPVREFDWHPERAILGLVTGSEYVYFWKPEGCHCIPQPFEDEERCSRYFEWGSTETSLMFMAGQNSCCLAVPDFI